MGKLALTIPRIARELQRFNAIGYDVKFYFTFDDKFIYLHESPSLKVLYYSKVDYAEDMIEPILKMRMCGYYYCFNNPRLTKTPYFKEMCKRNNEGKLELWKSKVNLLKYNWL